MSPHRGRIGRLPAELATEVVAEPGTAFDPPQVPEDRAALGVAWLLPPSWRWWCACSCPSETGGTRSQAGKEAGGENSHCSVRPRCGLGHARNAHLSRFDAGGVRQVSRPRAPLPREQRGHSHLGSEYIALGSSQDLGAPRSAISMPALRERTLQGHLLPGPPYKTPVTLALWPQQEAGAGTPWGQRCW